MGKSYKLISGILGLLGVVCFILFFVFNGSGKKVGDTFVVTFNSDGGTEVEKQTIASGGKVIKPDDPIKSDYIFGGWMLDDKEYDFSKEVTSDITLIANWKGIFDVVVTLEGNTYTKSYNEGEKISIVDFNFPQKDGLKVTLFEEDENGNLVEYDLDNDVKNSMNLTGEYRELTQVTIKFDSDGGSFVSDLKVNEGSVIIEPSVTKEGFTFIGWFKGDKLFDFTKPVYSDMTLVASWKDGTKVSVNFYVDDQKYDTILVTVGGKVTKPVDPTKEGYIFEGWKHNSKMFDFETTIEKDLTLTASFRTAKTFKVTFNSDGGTEVRGQTVIENEKVQKPDNPTKEGYRFVEWTYENATYDFEKPVTSHMTLKAKWEKTNSGFTVSFNSDGGTSIPSQTVEANQTATKPEDPVKEGATFVEWQLNGETYDFTKPVTENISLTAIWQ